MPQPLSEQAEQLLARNRLVSQLPNEHVSRVVSELIRHIVDTPALQQVLKAQFTPIAHHTLLELVGRGADIARNKVLYDAVCWVETGGDPLYHLPSTISGQRYTLERVVDWIVCVQNTHRPS